MRTAMIGVGLALVLLHHDVWWWSDGTVVGFMPVGLAYHVGYVLAVTAFWVWVILAAWPTPPDELDTEPNPEGDANTIPEAKPDAEGGV